MPGRSRLHRRLRPGRLSKHPNGPLFRNVKRGAKDLSRNPFPQINPYAMVERRAASAGIQAQIGNHTLPTTGLTICLRCGGTLEGAKTMANHASARMTHHYDRREEEVTLDEIELMRI